MHSSEIIRAATLFTAIYNTRSAGSNRALSTLLSKGGSYTGAETYSRADESFQKGLDFLIEKRLVRETDQGQMVVARADIQKVFEDGKNPNRARAINRLYARAVADMAPLSETFAREGFRDFASTFNSEHKDVLAYKKSKADFEASRGDIAPDRASLERSARAALAVLELETTSVADIKFSNPQRLDDLRAALVSAGLDPDTKDVPIDRRSITSDRARLEEVFAQSAQLSREISIPKTASDKEPGIRALMDLRISANSAVMKPRRELARIESRPVYGAMQSQVKDPAERPVPDRTSLERVVATSISSLRNLRGSTREMKGVNGYDGDRLDVLEDTLTGAFGGNIPTPGEVKEAVATKTRAELASSFDAAKRLMSNVRIGQDIEINNAGTAALMEINMSLGTSTYISAAEAREIENGEEQIQVRDDFQPDDRALLARALAASIDVNESGRFSLRDMDGSVSVDGKALAEMKTRMVMLKQMGLQQRMGATRQIRDRQSGAPLTVHTFRSPDLTRYEAELMRQALKTMNEVVRGDGQLAFDAGVTAQEDQVSSLAEQELSEADTAEMDAIFGDEDFGLARDTRDDDTKEQMEDRVAPKISESADLNTVATSYEKVKAFEAEERSRIDAGKKLADLAPAFEKLVDDDRLVDVNKEAYEAMVDAVTKLRDRGTLERIAQNADIRDERLVAPDQREQPEFASIEEAMSQGAVDQESHYVGDDDRAARRSPVDKIFTHQATGQIRDGLNDAKGILSEKDFKRLSAKERSFTHAVQLGGGSGPLGSYKPVAGAVALDRMINFIEDAQFTRNKDGEVQRDRQGNAARDRLFVEAMRRAANPDRTIVAPTLSEGAALRAVASGYVNRLEAEQQAQKDAHLRSGDLTRIEVSSEDAKKLTQSAIENGREIIDLHIHKGGVATLDNRVSSPISTRADYPNQETAQKLEKTVEGRSHVDLVKVDMIQGAIESGSDKIVMVLDGQKVIGAFGEAREDIQREKPKSRQFEDFVLS
jgi:hypothetical protein